MILLLLGTTLLLWIGYNFLVERLPETGGRNPLPALLLVVGCFYVGLRWVRGDVAK